MQGGDSPLRTMRGKENNNIIVIIINPIVMKIFHRHGWGYNMTATPTRCFGNWVMLYIV